MNAFVQPDLFDAAHSDLDAATNDYHQLPASEKQLRFARALSKRTGRVLPYEVQNDRKRLSDWIDETKRAAPSPKPVATSRFSNYPTSKQVAFAERLARAKRRDIPQECFKDKGLMSRWIDHNKG